MIIRDTTGRLYRVIETGDPNLAHLWLGQEVRKASAKMQRLGGVNYVAKHPLRAPELVRKAATKVVEN
jgi:hypothetical protein